MITNLTTISGSIRPISVTYAADDELLVSGEVEKNRAAWLEIIDHKLIDWGLKNGEVDEDGITWPSRKSLSESIMLIKEMSSKGMATPTHVVPNGDGGVVFEQKAGGSFESIEIFEDGSKEYRLFFNSLLQRRVSL
jgi:hypothetical protein